MLLSRGGGNIVVAMDKKIEVFDTTPNIVQVLFHRENSEDNNKVIIKNPIKNLAHFELLRKCFCFLDKGMKSYLFLMPIQVSVLQVPFFKARIRLAANSLKH